MSLLVKFKNFIKRLLKKNKKIEKVQTATSEPIVVEEELVEAENTLEQFKMRNVVFEKLKYLEQYIKLFSLNFPKEYEYYLNIIHIQREEYELELQKYNNGLLGEITFAIDPECESNRLIIISKLEKEIEDFVELKVNYSLYKDKFSKLCYKLIQFYNVLLDTNKEKSAVVTQLESAVVSLENLISNVSTLKFFNSDSRKKEIILNYVIYADYILFKSFLRCSLTENLENYKQNLSKFSKMFVSSEYNKLMFRFFIEDLERYQIYMSTNLGQEKTYSRILEYCKSLQAELNDYQKAFASPLFFAELIQLENTVDDISENCGKEYIITISDTLDASCVCETKISVVDTAISVLKLIDCNKSKILCKIIENFKSDISWREFFFLCKIFELYKEVVSVAHNTIFEFVGTKFCKLSTKYSKYSDSFILDEKRKLLNYHGQKSKRYVFLFNIESVHINTLVYELNQLQLDFLVSGNQIYLNHAYFNGFKNLEQNFGKYKLLEEIL